MTQPIVSLYDVVKLGHTGTPKARRLVVRNDLIAFVVSSATPQASSPLSPNGKPQSGRLASSASSLSNSTTNAPAAATAPYAAPMKRVIPVACILSLATYDNGMHLHITVRNEHDVLLWKQDGKSPVEDIVQLLLKLTRNSGNPVPFSKDANPIDPDDMNLIKSPSYATIGRRIELRRPNGKVVIPVGPTTLRTWDAVVGQPPYAIDPSKMSPPIQRALAGMHVVMLGSVLIHDRDDATVPTDTKVMAFTPSRIVVCEEDTGRDYVVCCLFSLTRMVLDEEQKRVQLQFSNESIASLTFSFPPKIRSAAAQSTTHVSEDISVIGNVIRYLLAREGVEVPTVRQRTTVTAAGSAPLGSNSGILSMPPSSTTPPPLSPTVAVPPQASSAVAPPAASAASKGRSPFPSSAMSPSSPTGMQSTELLLSTVPDYQKPQGKVAAKFRAPQVVLARQVQRLTSKGVWEPRVLLITLGQRLLICDEKSNVRRSVQLQNVTEVCHVEHWEGPALGFRVPSEHDLVLRAHPDCPAALTLAQVIAVIRSELPQIETREDRFDSKDKLRNLMMHQYRLHKSSTAETPAAELNRIKSSPSLGPTSTPTTTARDGAPSSSTTPPLDVTSFGSGSQSPSPLRQDGSLVASASNSILVSRDTRASSAFTAASPPTVRDTASASSSHQDEGEGGDSGNLFRRASVIPAVGGLTTSSSSYSGAFNNNNNGSSNRNSYSAQAPTNGSFPSTTSNQSAVSPTASNTAETAATVGGGGGPTSLLVVRPDRSALGGGGNGVLGSSSSSHHPTRATAPRSVSLLLNEDDEMELNRRGATATTTVPSNGGSMVPAEDEHSDASQKRRQQKNEQDEIAARRQAEQQQQEEEERVRAVAADFAIKLDRLNAEERIARERETVSEPREREQLTRAYEQLQQQHRDRCRSALVLSTSTTSAAVAAVATAPPWMMAAPPPSTTTATPISSSSSSGPTPMAARTPLGRTTTSPLPPDRSSSDPQHPPPPTATNNNSSSSLSPIAVASPTPSTTTTIQRRVIDVFSEQERYSGGGGSSRWNGTSSSYTPKQATAAGGADTWRTPNGPAGTTSQSSHRQGSATTPRSLFPTPQPRAPSTGGLADVTAAAAAPRFLRVKFGPYACAVAGLPSFVALLDEKFKGSAATSSNNSNNNNSSADHRVICVSTDGHGTVLCGNKSAFCDAVRLASLRGWIHQDQVMCRGSSYNWAEVPATVFVVGIERGNTPEQVADAKLKTLGGAA